MAPTWHRSQTFLIMCANWASLSQRERRVASGFRPRETGENLGITEETARSGLKKVFEKTGVSRQTDPAVLLSRLAIRTNNK